MAEKYVITVSREFGSLGRLVAEKAAEALGIEYYDRDLVEMTARELKVDADVVDVHDEKKYSRFEKMIYPMGANSSPVDQEHLYEVQKNIIIDLAMNKRPCIIVGRCADYILKDMPNVINVFIYSSYEKRLENCINEFNMSFKEAQRMIAKVDKARNAYHRFYTDQSLSNRDGKDLMIDSGVYGVDGAVEIIKKAVECRFGK
ncbi:MAG: AAA family ATPase [Candidatus Ornithomonoglobus sp.]